MNLQPVSNHPHVLLVEDNPGDILLVKESFRSVTSAFRLSVARDGQEAIDFLYGQGAHSGAARPDLILLDLNLPKIDGYVVLERLKSSAGLHAIPVVILSSSHAVADVKKAYSLSANCYLCKPGDLDEFFHLMRMIQEFWLGLVQLPRDEITGPPLSKT